MKKQAPIELLEFQKVLDRLDLKGILALQSLLAQQALKIHLAATDVPTVPKSIIEMKSNVLPTRKIIL